MAQECRNDSFQFDEHLRQQQRDLIDRLSLYANGCDPVVEPMQPLNSYSLLFGELVNVGIQRRVQQAYTTALLSEPSTGWIYVFHDNRDRPSVVKIGSTTGPTRRRIKQWRRELNDRRHDIWMLFAVKSIDVRLAEVVLHRLLFCQWQAKRVNIETGHRLLEYFDVANFNALRLLTVAVALHTDWFGSRTQSIREGRRVAAYEL